MSNRQFNVGDTRMSGNQCDKGEILLRCRFSSVHKGSGTPLEIPKLGRIIARVDLHMLSAEGVFQPTATAEE